MKRSTDRILTTHVGKLPGPDELTEAMVKDPAGRPTAEPFTGQLRQAVRDVVKRQIEVGIDIVNDGELGKTSWNSYLAGRLGGFERRPLPSGGRPPRAGAERTLFNEFYEEAERVGYMTYYRDVVPDRDLNSTLVCVGPISYTGHAALQEDIDNFKAALADTGVEEAFMPSTSPTVAPDDEFYQDQEKYLFALAEAMRTEYQMIVNAGIILHIDMPGLGGPNASIQEMRIAALNHALAGIPEDRVRLHVCWGGWNGPHTTDPSLQDALPVIFKTKAGGYLIESANPRHEHEWQVWQDVKLPEGKVLYPGLVSQKTNVVEHPDLIAWRLKLFAGVVGRENIVASTDCGLGSRVHPQIAWAKLEALAAGARAASKELWP